MSRSIWAAALREPRDESRAHWPRGSFLKAASAAAIGSSLAPAIVGAEDKSRSKNAVIGEGDSRYEAIHGWGRLPESIKWGETHDVTIDRAGFIHIKHRSTTPQPVDAIVVFDPDGEYVRSFGKAYHGGGHGIDVRKENAEEFLYLSDIKHGLLAKTNLQGEHVWVKERPAEPGVYDDPRATYSPTNVAFSPDGCLPGLFIHPHDACVDKDGNICADERVPTGRVTKLRRLA